MDGNMVGVEELNFLDSLLQQAKEGEKLIDPRVGKYEDAIVSEVVCVGSENGYRVEMKWAGLTDSNNMPFDYVDRLYCPDEDTATFLKARFMQKLKALGVLPPTYQNVIYCNSEEGSAALSAGIERTCLGNSYPIAISQSASGFVNLMVRNRAKPKQQ